MVSDKRLKQVLREVEEETKRSGQPPIGRQLQIDVTVGTVDDFIEILKYSSLIILKAFKEGESCDSISIQTTKELNEQLADTPDNEKTWNKIYESIPSCILRFTMRVFPVDDKTDDDYAMIVYCDLNSKEGKEMANGLIKKLGL